MATLDAVYDMSASSWEDGDGDGDTREGGDEHRDLATMDQPPAASQIPTPDIPPTEDVEDDDYDFGTLIATTAGAAASRMVIRPSAGITWTGAVVSLEMLPPPPPCGVPPTQEQEDAIAREERRATGLGYATDPTDSPATPVKVGVELRVAKIGDASDPLIEKGRAYVHNLLMQRAQRKHRAAERRHIMGAPPPAAKRPRVYNASPLAEAPDRRRKLQAREPIMPLRFNAHGLVCLSSLFDHSVWPNGQPMLRERDVIGMHLQVPGKAFWTIVVQVIRVVRTATVARYMTQTQQSALVRGGVMVLARVLAVLRLPLISVRIVRPLMYNSHMWQNMLSKSPEYHSQFMPPTPSLSPLELARNFLASKAMQTLATLCIPDPEIGSHGIVVLDTLFLHLAAAARAIDGDDHAPTAARFGLGTENRRGVYTYLGPRKPFYISNVLSKLNTFWTDEKETRFQVLETEANRPLPMRDSAEALADMQAFIATNDDERRPPTVVKEPAWRFELPAGTQMPQMQMRCYPPFMPVDDPDVVRDDPEFVRAMYSGVDNPEILVDLALRISFEMTDSVFPSHRYIMNTKQDDCIPPRAFTCGHEYVVPAWANKKPSPYPDDGGDEWRPLPTVLQNGLEPEIWFTVGHNHYMLKDSLGRDADGTQYRVCSTMITTVADYSDYTRLLAFCHGQGVSLNGGVARQILWVSSQLRDELMGPDLPYLEEPEVAMRRRVPPLLRLLPLPPQEKWSGIRAQLYGNLESPPPAPAATVSRPFGPPLPPRVYVERLEDTRQLTPGGAARRQAAPVMFSSAVPATPQFDPMISSPAPTPSLPPPIPPVDADVADADRWWWGAVKDYAAGTPLDVNLYLNV